VSPRKNIHLSKSQLIDFICETVLEVSHINEAIPQANVKMVDDIIKSDTESHKSTDKPETDHYTYWKANDGHEEFWKLFNAPEFIPSGKLKTVHPIIPVDGDDLGAIEPNAAYEVPDGTMVKNPEYNEFEEKYGKTREEFKKIMESDVVQTGHKAVRFYKEEVYNIKNTDTLNKLWCIKGCGCNNSCAIKAINHIREKLDMIANSWKYTNVFFSPKEVEKVVGNDDMNNTWGWYWWSKTGQYTYNINIYKWALPTHSEYENALFSTSVHELAHVLGIGIISGDLEIEAYEPLYKTNLTAYDYDEEDDEYLMDIESGGEDFAAIQNLRRVLQIWEKFGRTNISDEQWAQRWMEKVEDGTIDFDRTYNGVNLKDHAKANGFKLPTFHYANIDGGKSNGVFISFPKDLIKSFWTKEDKRAFGVTGVPTDYANIWTIIGNTLTFDNTGYDDITRLLSITTTDPSRFTCKSCSKDDIQIILDFEKIETMNDTFVDASEEIGDDLGSDTSKS